MTTNGLIVTFDFKEGVEARPNWCDALIAQVPSATEGQTEIIFTESLLSHLENFSTKFSFPLFLSMKQVLVLTIAHSRGLPTLLVDRKFGENSTGDDLVNALAIELQRLRLVQEGNAAYGQHRQRQNLLIPEPLAWISEKMIDDYRSIISAHSPSHVSPILPTASNVLTRSGGLFAGARSVRNRGDYEGATAAAVDALSVLATEFSYTYAGMRLTGVHEDVLPENVPVELFDNLFRLLPPVTTVVPDDQLSELVDRAALALRGTLRRNMLDYHLDSNGRTHFHIGS